MALLEQITHHDSLAIEDYLVSFFLKEKEIALEEFQKLGFPKKKDEEYKYTNLSEIIENDYQISVSNLYDLTDEEVESLEIHNAFYRVVFINGIFSIKHSKLPSEITCSSLKSAVQDQRYQAQMSLHLNTITSKSNAFAALNFGLFRDGFFLHVPKDKNIEVPIQVFYISKGQTKNTHYNTRNLLLVEQNAQVQIIETHHNLDSSFTFTNSVTEIFVDANAKADWHKLQNDVPNSYLVDHTIVKQERDSLATVNTFSFGGKLIRNNLDFIHNGENIQSFMNGITVIGENQLVDHHTVVHHKTPHCESYQNYKGIYKDHAHGVFNGKVFVDRLAQKTNAYQQNNNILLNEGANINTKPQLEIFADDVKCSHGCTVGQLNKEALEYLRSRGIPYDKAQALLLYAFTNSAIDKVNINELKSRIKFLLAKKLDVEVNF